MTVNSISNTAKASRIMGPPGEGTVVFTTGTILGTPSAALGRFGGKWRLRLWMNGGNAFVCLVPAQDEDDQYWVRERGFNHSRAESLSA